MNWARDSFSSSSSFVFPWPHIPFAHLIKMFCFDMNGASEQMKLNAQDVENVFVYCAVYGAHIKRADDNDIKSSSSSSSSWQRPALGWNRAAKTGQRCDFITGNAWRKCQPEINIALCSLYVFNSSTLFNSPFDSFSFSFPFLVHNTVAFEKIESHQMFSMLRKWKDFT